jgi:hypothetical protein
MIDSLHNATNNYYLINGDLRGIWNLVDPKPVIMNWNGSLKKESSDKFADLGFKQIASAYYDVGNTSTIRDWRMTMETNDSYEGAMYTTWNGDYRFLRAFSYYFWGAGPNFLQPEVDVCGNTATARVSILSDPYDNRDSIKFASIVIYNDKDTAEFPLMKLGGGSFGITNQLYKTNPQWNGTTIYYYFTATNQQGITNKSNVFVACPVTSSIDYASVYKTIMLVANQTVTISSNEIGEVRIVDILGKNILMFQHYGNGEQSYDLRGLQFGTYLSVFSTKKGVNSVVPFIHR